MKHFTLLIIFATGLNVFAKTPTEEMLGSQIRFSMSPGLEMKVDSNDKRYDGSRIPKQEGVKYSIPYFSVIRLNNQTCMMTHRLKLNVRDKDYVQKEPLFEKRIRENSPLMIDSSRTWTVIRPADHVEDSGRLVRLESLREDGTSDRINLRCFLVKDSVLDGESLTAAQIVDVLKSKGAVFMKDGKPLKVERKVAVAAGRAKLPEEQLAAACKKQQ